jgi:DoxX-like family
MKKTLWTIQILLALLFLFADGAKFVMPVDQMIKGMPGGLANGTFIHFIGVCEVLGGLGLVLPGLLHVMPGLTPLAASGLVIIMIGATMISVPQGAAVAAFPLVTGILAAFVAYGRWRLSPL